MAARGLFAATGKVAKEKRDRVPQDFYQTPPEVTKALISVEGNRLATFQELWEPAAGQGAMAKELYREGYEVIVSDITDRGCPGVIVQSFFDFHKPLAPAIVTNPPYNLTNWGGGGAGWITHALDVLKVEYMALLLPWTWPAAAGLTKVWDRHPPARVYLLTWKVDWTGQGAPPQNNAWFCWDQRWHGPDPILQRLGRPT
jgi:hypothetical protein